MTAIGLAPFFSRNDVQGIVFDLDGTLIDSAPDILGSIREALRVSGYGSVPVDYFPDNLHGTSDGIMRDVMADMGWQAPDDLSDLMATYVAIYIRRDHASTKLYPGVQSFLQACQDRVAMGICTNKVHRNAVAATKVLGIESYFQTISGADTWSESKPSPVPLWETIKVMGLEPEQCLYFGDTSVDALCAQRAGVRFVLFESGYGDAALVEQPKYHAFKAWTELLQNPSSSI